MARGKVTYDGKEYKSKLEFARENGISYNRLMYYINKKKLSFEEAATNVLLQKMYNEEQNDVLEEKEEVIVKEVPKKSVPSSVLSKPMYFDISSPVQIITELEKLTHISTINLIDFENVKKDKTLLKEYINRENTLNVFFYNALHHSNDFFKTIKESININLQVQIFEALDQLVDHLIIYYLGAIKALYPDINFNIISKDSAFYGFINTIKDPKIKGIGLRYIEDKELRYKFSLCKYIMDNKILSHRNYITKNEIEKIFSNFYKNCKKFISDEDIDDLVNSLVKFEMAKPYTEKGFKWLKFDMVHIKEFYEENVWN